MENVNFYTAFDKFGAEVFALAFAVCACVALVKKIFPKLSKRGELFLRFALAAAFYALYVTVLGKSVAACLEKGASICGVSYFVRAVFSGEEGESIIDEIIFAAIPKAKLTKKQLKEIKSQKTADGIKIALSKAADGRIPEAKLVALTNVIYEIKHRSESV